MGIKWFGLLTLITSNICGASNTDDENNRFLLNLVEDIHRKDGFDTLIIFNDANYTNFFSRSDLFPKITTDSFSYKMERSIQSRDNLVIAILNVEIYPLDFLNIDFLMDKHFLKILFVVSQSKKSRQMMLTLNKLYIKCWDRRIIKTLVYFDKDPNHTLYTSRLSSERKGWSIEHVSFPQKTYYPPVKNLHKRNVQVSFEEEQLPLLMIYLDKVSNDYHMGGFQYHMIKAFGKKFNAHLVYSNLLAKADFIVDERNNRVVHAQTRLRHLHEEDLQEFFITQQVKFQPSSYLEYYSNQLLCPTNIVKRVNIYGKAFDWFTWLVVIGLLPGFSIVSYVAFKDDFVHTFFDGVKFYLNQAVRFPSRRSHVYRTFFFIAFVFNTMYSNLYGTYNKLMYYDGINDHRVGIINHVEINQSQSQIVLSKNAHILDPLTWETFREIQKFTNNYSFKRMKMLNKTDAPISFFDLGRLRHFFLVDELNTHILLSYSSGLIQKWKQKVAFEYFRGNLTNIQMDKVLSEVKFEPESIENLLIPFVMVAGGWIVASVAFYLEILITLCKGNNTNVSVFATINLVAIFSLLLCILYLKFFRYFLV